MKDLDTYLIQIGKRIIEIRESKNFSQYRLAKELFMEQSNLARIENGKTNPTIKTLYKICNSLNIKLEDLFSV